MGETLGREFTPGKVTTGFSMGQSTVPGQQMQSDGLVAPTQYQVPTVHQRPTFISAFLQNLPTALGAAAGQSDFGKGLGAGFQAIEEQKRYQTQEADQQQQRQRQTQMDALSAANTRSEIGRRDVQNLTDLDKTQPAKSPEAQAFDYYVSTGLNAADAHKKVSDDGRAAATTGAPRTITTDKGIMQWNPATNAFDIKAGNAPLPKTPTEKTPSQDAFERSVGSNAATAVQTAQTADFRYNSMNSSYPSALKGDQQAMLNLLTNHLGMTMGMQKGARITQAILNEAQNSTPWLAGVKAKFDSRGYLSGLTLTPDQMKSMMDLAVESRKNAWQTAKQAGEQAGVADRIKVPKDVAPPPPPPPGFVIQ